MAEIRLRADAFDSFAAGYDQGFAHSEPGRFLRRLVWERLQPFLRPGMRALDLGCGTGEDAVWLAGAGCEVVAADASPAMLDVAWRKAMEQGVGDRVETRLFDLNAPADIDGPFDLVMSNFGALNCAVDLAPIADGLRRMVAPGGVVALVVMGRFCAWETLWHGARLSRTSVRRWSGRGSAAIGERTIPIRYWQPGEVIRALGPTFTTLSVQPVGLFLPPSDLFPFLARHPGLFRRLAGWERRAAAGARLADHHLTILRQEDARS